MCVTTGGFSEQQQQRLARPPSCVGGDNPLIPSVLREDMEDALKGCYHYGQEQQGCYYFAAAADAL